MRILVNTLSITADRGGVKTFIVNLVEALLEVDRGNQYVLLCSTANYSLFVPLIDRFPNVRIRKFSLESNGAMARIWYDQVVVPWRARRYTDAVLLSQASVASLFAPLPQVVIVQTALAVAAVRRELPDDENYTTALQRFYYDALLPLSLRKSDQIIVVSEHLRQSLLRDHEKYRSKIKVVYEGVDLYNFGSRDDAYIDGKEAPYVLFVGTLFPYKNVAQLVRAFAELNHAGKVDSRLRLKIAGSDPDGKQCSQLEKLASTLGMLGKVDILGRVEHESVSDLYAGAELLVFPSSVESFGLPVLEAMSSGTPVIAANRMSLPEVVGDAGIITNPDDVSMLSDAMEKVLTDSDLQSQLIQKGKKRVRKFTWRKTAQGVLEALEQAQN